MAKNMKKIIAVDDDLTNVTALKSTLKPLYEVYTALSAEKMFEILAKVVPDLILLDVEMPEMNGYEAIQKLKSDIRYAHVPVIFISAKTDVNSESEGFTLGAADYVSKPFSTPLLLKRIENQIIIAERDNLLRTANARLNAVISNYAGIIWSVDSSEIISLFNGLYLDKIGFSPSFFEGKTLDDAMRHDRHLAIIDKTRQTFTDGPQEWISEIDGKRFHAYTTPIFDDNGRVSGVVGSIDDLTDMIALQDKLETTAARLKAVVANYPGVICAADKNLNITLFDGLLLPSLLDNQWFFEGQTIEGALQRDEYKHIMGKVFDTFNQGAQDWSFEINNKVFHMTTTPMIESDGSVSGVVGRIDDVTEMTRLQEQLSAALEEARNAGKVAEEASHAKSNFLANMSHEIRTPLNAIIGMSQIAAKTDEVERLKYCLANIENSSTHLLGLINDILDMSKIEAGKLDIDNAPLNIEKMLVKVCNLVIEKTEQKNIKFNIVLGSGMRMHYVGDELRLSQVVTNLLSNAVKFTPEEGKIELTVKEIVKDKESSILQFSVRDTGIGMTEEQVSRLFTAFEQAETSTAQKFGGTGLGLAISKSIVEKMDGRIWVESEIGMGSEFVFEVKLERPEQQTGAIIYGNIRPSDITMLVLDADADERTYFKSIVNSFGITAIDEANTVEQAVDSVVKARNMDKPYDIVFVDYRSAGDEGIEMFRQSGIRLDRDNVVAMASFLTWSKIEDAVRDIGIKRFVPKPLFPSAVLDEINGIIGGISKQLDITSESVIDGAPDFSDITVLFAEDVEINREIFSALLEDTGINIDVAENGLIAVEKFKANPEKYDIIIMDVQMPEMDGYEATISIRFLGTERAMNIPIVAMTANVFKEDVEKCLAAGMDDHLAKPIEVGEVFKKINQYCRKG
ncbi:MAG: response regulator [Oscillospiraceae bacterium]|nr:response regulator [Oscillospiraceae bacterium]